jgi:hypothetical protein
MLDMNMFIYHLEIIFYQSSVQKLRTVHISVKYSKIYYLL